MKLKKKLNVIKLILFLIFVFLLILFIYLCIPIYQNNNVVTSNDNTVNGAIVRKNKTITEEEVSFKINNEQF